MWASPLAMMYMWMEVRGQLPFCGSQNRNLFTAQACTHWAISLAWSPCFLNLRENVIKKAVSAAWPGFLLCSGRADIPQTHTINVLLLESSWITASSTWRSLSGKELGFFQDCKGKSPNRRPQHFERGTWGCLVTIVYMLWLLSQPGTVRAYVRIHQSQWGGCKHNELPQNTRSLASASCSCVHLEQCVLRELHKHKTHWGVGCWGWNQGSWGCCTLVSCLSIQTEETPLDFLCIYFLTSILNHSFSMLFSYKLSFNQSSILLPHLSDLYLYCIPPAQIPTSSFISHVGFSD